MTTRDGDAVAADMVVTVAGAVAIAAVAGAAVAAEVTPVVGATVGEGMPIDDCVGVGVPMTTRDGDAVAADMAVTGAVAIAAVAGAAVAGAAMLVVGATVAAAVVPPPLTIVMPAPLSLMIAGVASELAELFTVTSGFAMSAGF